MRAGMTRQFERLSRLLLIIGSLLLLSATVQAQVRYVATYGSDANSCTNASAACRTLQRAADMAPAGGEVRVLDSGAYSPLVINKSLTVTGAATTLFGTRVTVNNANAIAVLRGLHLNGNRYRAFGVFIAAAAAVHIENCVVEGFATHGIYDNAANAKVSIADSILRDNAVAGLAVNGPDNNTKRLTVDNSRIENNGGDGAFILGGTSTFIRSVISGNYASGINLNNGTATIVETTSANRAAGYTINNSVAVLERSGAQSNQFGVVVSVNSDVTLSNSVITNNSSKGIIAAGTVRTRGNNTVTENGTDVDGTLTPLAGT